MQKLRRDSMNNQNSIALKYRLKELQEKAEKIMKG